MEKPLKGLSEPTLQAPEWLLYAKLIIDGFHGAWLHLRKAKVGDSVCSCVQNTG